VKFRCECETKSGRKLLIRSLTPADAEEALAVCRKTAGETAFMLRGENEWTISAEQQAAAIKRAEDGAKSLMLGAFAGGRLAGVANLRPVHPGDRARHRAGVGIAVLRACWGQGIGSALLGSMIEAAKTTNLEQLELDVVEGNAAAVALYEKHGFSLIAERKRYYKDPLEDACIYRYDKKESNE
jgi:ribosomal protein S18 acetylase RimI-like enzyme